MTLNIEQKRALRVAGYEVESYVPPRRTASIYQWYRCGFIGKGLEESVSETRFLSSEAAWDSAFADYVARRMAT